ncbi:4-amino-4-deoxychorismate lyase [Paenibacillus oralis]|uniref:4-amino-4-deoxychorismate lyase n=1 Tax=Paenibacillus oralis TaxID=2490856 RepID=A0A3P3TYA1_9BACL|nr:aminotransferase class IV [Paenibacillus oralis]RRJ63085.1 4-amino-4-deoxychorismate lyase [Paenibacillus oralis]
MNYIGVNGVPTPAAEAVISVMDHGFMYGIGLFETFRTYGGRPFLLERHLGRLRAGCEALGIRLDLVSGASGAGCIRRQIAELLELNGLTEGYIRVTVTAGEGPLGLPSGDYGEPAAIIYVKPLPEPPASLYSAGKPLWRLGTRRNTPEGEVRFKSLHYMNNVLAKRELTRLEREAGASAFAPHNAAPGEGLLLTAEGWLAEGIVSNLFFVQNGKLYTPDIGTGILPGITRAVVLELTVEGGLEREEGFYAWDRLLEADEVFVTNSIQEIVPVTELVSPGIPAVKVGNGRIGPVTQSLLDKYRQKARNFT